MNLGPILDQLIRGDELSPEQAGELMSLLVRGEATQAQSAGIMVALRAKGVSGEELASFARVLRENAVRLTSEQTDLVDIVGTGGGSPSFNISTAASIAAAAAGAHVAKHGNRAVTSRCGSADVLEALGMNLYGDAQHLHAILQKSGFVFMLAPTHHPALRHVAPARKELGVRTVFNMLGPLVNPAGAQRQLIGVYDRALSQPMAQALRINGIERALVVHADDGLDEVSPSTATHYVKVWEGVLEEGYLRPADFGLAPLSEEAVLPAETVDGNAAILREALEDGSSPRSQAILPSAATALWMAGLAATLPQGVDLARGAIESGAAIRKLGEIVGLSHVR